MSERAEAAARRLGAPSCQQCKRLGVTEHVAVFGDPEARDRYYIGMDLCRECAEECDKTQADLDRINALVDSWRELPS